MRPVVYHISAPFVDSSSHIDEVTDGLITGWGPKVLSHIRSCSVKLSFLELGLNS